MKIIKPMRDDVLIKVRMPTKTKSNKGTSSFLRGRGLDEDPTLRGVIKKRGGIRNVEFLKPKPK